MHKIDDETEKELIQIRRTLIKALQDVEEALHMDDDKRLTRRRRERERERETKRGW